MFSCPSTNGLLNVSCCKAKSQPNYIFAKSLPNFSNDSVWISLSVPPFLIQAYRIRISQIWIQSGPLISLIPVYGKDIHEDSSLWQGYTRSLQLCPRRAELMIPCGYVDLHFLHGHTVRLNYCDEKYPYTKENSFFLLCRSKKWKPLSSPNNEAILKFCLCPLSGHCYVVLR